MMAFTLALRILIFTLFPFDLAVVDSTGAERECEHSHGRQTGILQQWSKGKFEIVVCLNELTFQNYPLLIDELEEFARKAKSPVVRFGDIHIDRNSGQIITESIRKGMGFSSYKSFAAKTIIKREMAKI